MIALLLAQAAAAAPPMPPADWSGLPELPAPSTGIGLDPSGYVRREVAAKRCQANASGAGWEMAAPVAVLVDAGGRVQRVVPRAIDCPTVEQFTAGYVSTLARRSGAAGALRPGWYRYTVTYRWAG